MIRFESDKDEANVVRMEFRTFVEAEDRER